MDDAVRAIADPTRRAILRLVREQELPAGEIARRFDVTRPAVSQHLRVLREAGLITERREGTFRYYRANPNGLNALRDALGWLWDDGLARLKAAAEDEQRRRQSDGERAG